MDIIDIIKDKIGFDFNRYDVCSMIRMEFVQGQISYLGSSDLDDIDESDYEKLYKAIYFLITSSDFQEVNSNTYISKNGTIDISSINNSIIKLSICDNNSESRFIVFLSLKSNE